MRTEHEHNLPKEILRLLDQMETIANRNKEKAVTRYYISGLIAGWSISVLLAYFFKILMM